MWGVIEHGKDEAGASVVAGVTAFCVCSCVCMCVLQTCQSGWSEEMRTNLLSIHTGRGRVMMTELKVNEDAACQRIKR